MARAYGAERETETTTLGRDVLQLPLIGRLLRWRYGRLILQVVLTVIALLLMIDGFTGPQVAARNLATVAPWVHFRGLVVLALLLAGNLFCMGCPFTLPRTLAKRLSLTGYRFPKRLRNKWIAIGSLFALFFLYEYLDLWASPWLTAWLILAYFLASFVMEALFTESAFCKYVCPLGSFNYVYSTLSPTQIEVRSHDICATCVGKECVNGSYAQQSVVRTDAIPILGSEEKRQVEVVHGPQGTLGCGTDYSRRKSAAMLTARCAWIACALAHTTMSVSLGARRVGSWVCPIVGRGAGCFAAGDRAGLHGSVKCLWHGAALL